MPYRSQLLRSARGVRLERIEMLCDDQRVLTAFYSVTTPREKMMRRIADEREAQDTFDLQIIASLMAPRTDKSPPS